MNIFVLDLDREKCARYHVDKHVVKMITEYNQILSSAYYYTFDIPEGIYKLAYRNHRCCRWVRESAMNWRWLYGLNAALCREYTYRYGKVHAGEYILRKMPPFIDLPEKGLTPFALAMPDDCKNVDAVTAYRAYYNNYKRELFHWKGREVPPWIERR